MTEAEELPQNLVGSARASALAVVDRRYHGNALIIADLSNDASYAEYLIETFGRRVIGVQITRHGDGMEFERRPVNGSAMMVYAVGRTYLFELLQAELQCDQVRMAGNAGLRQAYEQLANLETEFRESGTVYSCPTGQHDDLAISCAMLVWAARHPHLQYWVRSLETRPRRPREKFNWAAVT
jgi:hypothetical protein